MATTTPSASSTSSSGFSLSNIFLLVAGGFIVWKVMNSKESRSNSTPMMSGKTTRRKFPREERAFPREGKGRFHAYVQYMDKGGVDHFFKSASERDSFRKKMNKRYEAGDANIYKVR